MMSTTTVAVPATSPAAGYIGGKRNLARRLVALIGAIEHQAYYEPFVGMGGIFLRRTSKPPIEAINDLSGDVATFFRVLQEHYAYFVDLMRFRVASRHEFERLRALPPERLTDLQRAARFLYLQRLAFGGKVEGRAFGVDKNAGARFNLAKLEPTLADIHERLQDVVIEQLPYTDFIRRYDRAGALFYLDPPYHGSEGDYGKAAFGRDDFAALAAQLAGIKGSFLLSINDAPEIREIFAGFAMRSTITTYQVGINGKPAGELVIAGGAPAIAALEAAAL